MYVVAKLRIIYSAASQLSCLKKNTPLQASLRVCSSLAKVTFGDADYLSRFGSLSLVLHSSWWLWCVIKEDSVNAWYFCDYTVYEVVDEFVGEVFYCYFHNICCVDGTDDAWPVECTLSIFNAC